MIRILPSNVAITQFDLAIEYACAEQIAEGTTHKWELLNRLMLGRELSIERVALRSWHAAAALFAVTGIEAFRAVNLYRAWDSGFLTIDWSKPITLKDAEIACGMRGSNGLYANLFSGYYHKTLPGVNERARANGGVA